IWTFAVIAGAIWADQAWGRYWGWDPKETWAFITWVVYAGYLHARATAGWRGRKAAYIHLIGLASLVFNLVGVNLWVTRPHSYARRSLLDSAPPQADAGQGSSSGLPPRISHSSELMNSGSSSGPITDPGSPAPVPPCRDRPAGCRRSASSVSGPGCPRGRLRRQARVVSSS